MRHAWIALALWGCTPSTPPPDAAPAAPMSAPTSAAEAPGVEPSLPGLGGDAALTAALRAEIARRPGHTPRTHHRAADGSPTFVNRLIRETSPYLLQHAHNPVNWRPWGPEAFAEATRRGVPVLLSVGYSTCHWCHVMERESFEDLEIAAFINRHFVAIKVDREERPDVDDVYMKAVNLLTGRGGWPMTVMMTPDKRPFFGGTYFPARDGDRGSRKGFLTLLGELSARYRDDRAGVVAEAQQLSARMAGLARPQRPGDVPGPAALERTARRMAQRFDPRWGGWGRAPKFPRPVQPSFLLRYHRRTGDATARHQVLHTLRAMAQGGLYDHLAGGFHRYSTDRRWLVPHFEKMLYDQGQLVRLYVDAWQLTQANWLRRVATETLDYVAREMTAPHGGFYSATDADSPTPAGHDEEGWFFTWTEAEIRAVLPAEDARRVIAWFGLTARGNFEGRNILRTWDPPAQVAQRLGVSVPELQASVARSTPLLYAARETRPPPIKDTKIITSWNGLMIGAFARGGLAFDAPRHLARARAAADFVLTRMRRPDGRLVRTYSEGTPRGLGFLDDYAFVIEGLLDLFEATGEPRWLREARALQAVQDADLSDPVGGYYASGTRHEALLTREKPDYDGAEPSGNAVAALNLLRLAELTSHQGYTDAADRLLGAFGDHLERRGLSVPRLSAALDYARDRPRQVVVVSTPDDDGAALWAVVRRTYLPNRALFRVTPAHAEALRAASPLVADKVARAQATAYVCEAGRCERPTSDPKVLAEQLARVEPLYPDRSAAPLGSP